MESLFECEVCMVAYNINEHRPRFLLCGHTMCSSCINKTLKSCNGRPTCPFCRTQCGRRVTNLEDFPTAFVLLNLLEKKEQTNYSDAFSPKDMESKLYLEKKQAEYNHTRTHISNCKEHLAKLLHAKQLQESIIESIETEQKKLEEDKDKANTKKDELKNILTEGNDIVKDLEALQDRLKCSTSLLGLNEVNQDGQRHYKASDEWVTSIVRNTLTEDTNELKEKMGSDHGQHPSPITTTSTSGAVAPQRTPLRRVQPTNRSNDQCDQM